MENLNLGEINSIWGMVPVLLYIIYGIVRDIRKNRREKENTAVVDILKKLDDHIKADSERYSNISRNLHAQKVLISILLTPANCSQPRFQQLEKEYFAAKEKGVNGIVSQAFVEFCEKREKSLTKKRK